MSDPFRQTYRELTEDEKAAIRDLKEGASDLQQVLDRVPSIAGQTFEAGDRNGERRRALALAHTKLQEAVMWATHGITA